MTVTIDYSQTCTVEEGPLYKVVITVTYVEHISPQIFVINTELGTFEHVATPYDMENVVPTLIQAVADGRDYYRAAVCTVSYETETAAMEFIEYTEDRIQALATAYENVVEDFEGVTTHHVVSA